MIYIQLANNPQPIATKYSLEEAKNNDDLFQYLCEIYGLNFIGLFDNKYEAFRAYLMSKEMGYDTITLEELEQYFTD